MKIRFAVVLTALVCVGVRASDGQDDSTLDGRLPEPVSSPTEPYEIRATGLLIPQASRRELLDCIYSCASDDIDDGLAVFVGETERLRAWIEEQLRNHRAILNFDTLGRTYEGRPWQFETGPSEASMPVPYMDERGATGVRVMTGIKTGPRLRITPVVFNSLGFEVAYRPPVFIPSESEASASADGHDLHSGCITMPGVQYSLVLASDVDVDPLPFIVVTGRRIDGEVSSMGSVSGRTIAAPASGAAIGSPWTTNDVRSPNSEAEPVQQPEVSSSGRSLELTSGEARTIELHEHETFRVSLEKKISFVSGFNPDVVEVTASDPHGLQIQAHRAGATRLTIVDEDDEALALTVIVSRDLTDLELLLERLYPEANVEVVPIRDTVLLRGTVDDAEQVRQIEEIAGQFAPQVLNQLRVEGDTASPAIPPGLRLMTIYASCDIDVLEPGELVDVVVVYRGLDPSADPVIYTGTLLESVEVFSVKTRTVGVGGENSAVASVFGLLVHPEEAEALSFADDLCDLRLRWRASADASDPESRLDRALLSELERLAHQPALAEGSPPPGITSPYLNHQPPLTFFPGSPPSPQPDEAAGSGRDSASDLQSLRDDIRALHEDVRRLIEVLEDRNGEAVHGSDEQSSAPEMTPAMLDLLPTITVFTAEWCEPCQQMIPVLRQLEKEGFRVRTIDVDDERAFADVNHVKALPTTLFLYGNTEVERIVGVMGEEELRSRVTRSRRTRIGRTSRIDDLARENLGIHLKPGPDFNFRNTPFRGGLYVDEVRAGSPAERAGIEEGDLLVGLHVWETKSLWDLEFVLDHPDRESFFPLKFYVLRDGETPLSAGQTLCGYISRAAPPGSESVPDESQLTPFGTDLWSLIPGDSGIGGSASPKPMQIAPTAQSPAPTPEHPN